PEFLPPLPPQSYLPMLPIPPETVSADPFVRANITNEVIQLCRAHQVRGAGFMSVTRDKISLAASTGLRAYDETAHARLSVTAIGSDSTGWIDRAHRSIHALEPAHWTNVAIEKARQSAHPRSLPPGRYTVLLEPAAVAGLLAFLIEALDAKDYESGASPVSGKLGTRILDSRFTLEHVPDHPHLLGARFMRDGLAHTRKVWIQQGVLKQLAYDRFTAQVHGVDPTPALNAPVLAGESSAARSVSEMIRQINRGILVTNLWYIRPANPVDLTLTGMTRDGTFLIEDGEITTGLCNFRFHDSPLRVFQAVDSFSEPMEAISAEYGKMLVPFLTVRDFHFTSCTNA
ncbi:MAG: hypothetical protein D6704_08565, partial [Nitrospirae bacterium]